MHAAIEIIKEKIAVLSRQREEIRSAAKSYEKTVRSQRQMEAKATGEIRELEKGLSDFRGWQLSPAHPLSNPTQRLTG